MCNQIIMENVFLSNLRSLKLKMGLTPCKAEQPLRVVKLQEKEVQKD